MSEVRVELNGDTRPHYDAVRDVSGAMIPTKVTIRVERQDWQLGRPKDPAACGIARAAKRIFPQEAVWIGSQELEVVTPGGEYYFRLPLAARLATRLYDRLGRHRWGRRLLPRLTLRLALAE
jgi:hypothetical protein